MNLISFGFFGLILLIILAFISSQSPTNLSNIDKEFKRLTCPMPAISGLWNQTNVLQYTGATYNYRSVSNQTLTLTCTQIHTLNGVDYNYGQPTVAIGVFYFAQDVLSSVLDKVLAFFTLVSIVLSPANFSILGYDINDLNTTGKAFVIAIYIASYIAIGAMIYKLASPFSGG